ncbi:MAG: hypothetical protein ACM37U_00470 [Gemmatimonas sp.]
MIHIGTVQHPVKFDPRVFCIYYRARDCTGLPACQQISRELVSAGEAIKLERRAIKTLLTT